MLQVTYLVFQQTAHYDPAINFKMNPEPDKENEPKNVRISQKIGKK